MQYNQLTIMSLKAKAGVSFETHTHTHNTVRTIEIKIYNPFYIELSFI